MMVLISISQITNGVEHLFMFFEHMCIISCEIVVVVVIVVTPPLVYNLLCVRNYFKHIHHLIIKQFNEV